MESTDQRVSSTVRGRLAQQRMSGSALAVRLGMSQAAVSRRLNGDVSFSIQELAAIAEILGVPVASLLPEPVKAVS